MAAEQGGALAVDDQLGLQATQLRVAGHVAERRIAAQLLYHLAGPGLSSPAETDCSVYW